MKTQLTSKSARLPPVGARTTHSIANRNFQFVVCALLLVLIGTPAWAHYPPNIASVKVTGNRAAFTTLGYAGYAMNRINPINPTVRLVNGPDQNELSAVTLGEHMLVGIRRWRIVIANENPPDLRVETEAYDQDNGYWNMAGRNSGYGQARQYEVWHDYLSNIANHWASSAGATSSGESHIEAQDVGTTNPWRSQLPPSLQ